MSLYDYIYRKRVKIADSAGALTLPNQNWNPKISYYPHSLGINRGGRVTGAITNE